MEQILLKFENKLPKKYITIPLQDQGEYSGTKGGNTDISPSKYIGITEPLISINNSVIPSGALRSFNLSIKNHIPKVKFTFDDWNRRFTIADRSNVDNIVLVQILPKFEDKYSKINLRFYIEKFKLDDRTNEITISAIYNIEKIYDTDVKSYGNITSYSLFETLSKNLKLGFASNIPNQIDDTRWIYQDSINNFDCMNREIKISGNSNVIIDYWIDWWNNINYVDIKDRWKNIATDDELKIFIGEFLTDANANHEVKYRESKAIIHNNPNFPNDPLFMSVCTFKNNFGTQIRDGNNKTLYLYDYINNTYNDINLQDKDVKTNVFSKQIYIGENMLDTDYLSQKYYRESNIQKMLNNTVIVELTEPQFGLMKGSKCELMYFEHNEIQQAMIQEGQSEMNNEINQDVNNKIEPYTMIPNLDISGQYYIYDCSLRWEENIWTQQLILTKPNTNESYTKIMLNNNG